MVRPGIFPIPLLAITPVSDPDIPFDDAIDSISDDDGIDSASDDDGINWISDDGDDDRELAGDLYRKKAG